MRKKIVAANWKMFTTLDESADLATALKAQLATIPQNVTVIVCPPFTSLALVSNVLKGSHIKVGAQNMSEHDEGAYTGEISWKMIRSTGSEYVILGHSERRQYFDETNEQINRKAKKALANGLMPIICVGEHLEEREAGITEQVVTTQLRGVLHGFSDQEMSRAIIAYEPVWAIGTGKNASPMQAEEVHKYIRKLISQLFNWSVAERCTVQYGGSVRPDNAADLLLQDDIDGALVGGASLKVDSFSKIVFAYKS